MKHLMWCFKWLLKAAIFFTLFAFALNNQQDATVHFFFGTRWSAPLVLVVLAAFACGVAIGALGMVPRWWKHRSAAQKAAQKSAPTPGQSPTESVMPSELLPSTLPRHGS